MPVEPVIVSDQRTLDRHCRAWREQGRFCFDTEFIRDETFDAKLCLVQVNAGEDVVLIDPLAEGLDIKRFWKLVTDPEITAIIHAGGEDFDVCLRSSGQPPRNVFDVQIAAGFVGLGYPLSLARLVRAALGQRLVKGQTLTDWARRPLTDEQIRYATDDVAYLPSLYADLSARLEASGRTAWAREEFRRFEDAAFYRPPAADRLFKLKGSKKLDGLGLALLERLIDWRDQWAAQRNRPTRALMRDDILVEIAKRRPTKTSQLEVLRGFHQSRNPKVVRGILEVIRAGREIPRSQWPTPFVHREDSPMTKVTLDILSAYTRAVCHEEHLDHDLVGSAKRLRELLDHLHGHTDEKPALLAGWRNEFIGSRLVDLLEGRCELHLSGWPESPHLSVVMHSPEDVELPRTRPRDGRVRDS